jgi:hypothetical protein
MLAPRTISWLLLCLLAVLAAPLRADQSAGAFTYTSDATSVTITGYSGMDAVVTVPSAIASLPVQAIAPDAFSGVTSITSINLPDTLLSLGARAFAGCTGIAEITLPGQLQSIGDQAFHGCTALRQVSIWGSFSAVTSSNAFDSPGSLTLRYISGASGLDGPVWSLFMQAPLKISLSYSAIGYTLYGYTGTDSDLFLPTSVGGKPIIRIAQETFKAATFSRITLPENLSIIDDSAFAGCSQLTQLTIPDSVVNINANAFSGCTKLASLSLPAHLASLSPSCFANCSSLTAITLPTDLSSIGDFAFGGCSKLQALAIPAGVTSIGQGIVSQCTALTQLTVDPLNPKYVSTDNALYLKSPSTLIAVAAGLERSSFVIPSGTTAIGPWALYGADKLQQVTLPGTLTSIGLAAFYGCSSLTSVEIPSKVSRIEDIAFYNLPKLAKATFLGNAPSYFGGSVFDAAATGFTIYYTAGATGFTQPTWHGYPSSELAFSSITVADGISITGYLGSSTTVVIPPSILGKPVTEISANAFSSRNDLRSIEIPSTVLRIDPTAFADCSSLYGITVSAANPAFLAIDGVLFGESGSKLLRYPAGLANSRYSIPSGVRILEAHSFSGASLLIGVEIPASVRNIGEACFQGCSNLGGAQFDGNAPDDFGSLVFDGTAPGFTISVAMTALGFSTPTWKGYPVHSGDYAYTDSGAGLMITGYSGTDTTLQLPSSILGRPVIGIAASAFAGNTALSSAVLPEGLTSLGDHAFANCTQLTSASLPASLASVGTAPFLGCGRLSSLTLSAGNTHFSLWNGLLMDKGLTRLIECPQGLSTLPTTLPSSLASIAPEAFRGCSALRSLQLPSSLVSIGEEAFSDCSSLTLIQLAGDAPSLAEAGAFNRSPGVRFYYQASASGYSSAAWVSLSPLALHPNHLSNLSTRSFVGKDDKSQFAGFVIGGTEPKRVLVRASGPALKAFNVSGVLEDPTLILFDSTQTKLAANDDWDPTSIQADAARVGAFPWSSGSKDAALLLSLKPGSYTVQVSGKDGGTGIALVEIYDADATPQSNLLTNISTRSLTLSDDQIQIAGFVVSGDKPKQILVRASGPALKAFGLNEAMNDPVLKVVGANQALLDSNDDWDATTIQAAAQKVGAFAWPVGSKDAALLMTLKPGNYTAMVSGKGTESGITLVEVYDVP